MNNDVIAIIEESIQIELNVSVMYSLFHKLFPEDEDFWWQLVLEEKNHATLIRSAKKHYEQFKDFPDDMLHYNLQDLKNSNSELLSIIKEFNTNPPSREEAFNVALKIETSASELHFQEFMGKDTDSIIDGIFKELNNEDKEHARRIHQYMEGNGISLQ